MSTNTHSEADPCAASSLTHVPELNKIITCGTQKKPRATEVSQSPMTENSPPCETLLSSDEDECRLDFPDIYSLGPDVRGTKNVNPPSGYFMPFVGQPHPLRKLPLAKTENRSFIKRMERRPFRPRNSPETHWIAFVQELVGYLTEYFPKGNAISKAQLRVLLQDHLGDFDRYDPLPADELLAGYQYYRYTFYQAARDYHDWGKDPRLFIKYGEKLAILEGKMRLVPRYRLTLHLYRCSEALREKIFLKFATEFTPASFPREMSEETYSIITDYMKEQFRIMRSPSWGKKAEFFPSSRPKRTDDREDVAKNPRKRARWLGFKDRSYVSGVKRRRHQALVNPEEYHGGPVITTEEVEYRKHNELCLECGNHKRSENINISMNSVCVRGERLVTRSDKR